MIRNLRKLTDFVKGVLRKKKKQTSHVSNKSSQKLFGISSLRTYPARPARLKSERAAQCPTLIATKAHFPNAFRSNVNPETTNPCDSPSNA